MNPDQCERCQSDEVFRDGLCKTCWWMRKQEELEYWADLEMDRRRVEGK